MAVTYTENYNLGKQEKHSDKFDMAVITENMDKIDAALAGKVDKESGKGLSTNDFTDADKSKLDSLENYDDTEIKAEIDNITDNIFGAGEVIPSGADLNSYTKAGVYYCNTGAVSATITNNPCKTASFKLEVIKTIATANRFVQKIFPNDTTGLFYMRTYAYNGLGSWYKFSGEVVTTT